MKKLFSELMMVEPFTLMEPLRPLKVVLARNLEQRQKGREVEAKGKKH
jgi:hypothetical protein